MIDSHDTVNLFIVYITLALITEKQDYQRITLF